MSLKITPDHLGRAAVVYIRQSTLSQVSAISRANAAIRLGRAATAAGFAAVTVIDDDLGRSGSGLMVRPAALLNFVSFQTIRDMISQSWNDRGSHVDPSPTSDQAVTVW